MSPINEKFPSELLYCILVCLGGHGALCLRQSLQVYRIWRNLLILATPGCWTTLVVDHAFYDHFAPRAQDQEIIFIQTALRNRCDLPLHLVLDIPGAHQALERSRKIPSSYALW